MSIELIMLLYSVALLVVLVVVQASAATLEKGLPAMAGSRDNLGEPGAFQARSKRVVDNHREGLLIFAPLVVIAALSGVSTPMTVLGAQLFFYSRLVHGALYLTGVPWVRTLVWAVGIIGCIMIFFELLGAIG